MGGLLKGCAIVLAIGALLLGGAAYCGYSLFSSIKAEMPVVDGQVTAWMASYDAGDFAACYRAADGSFTAAGTEADFIRRLATLREQTGRVVLGSRTGFFMNTTNGDTTARCQWAGSGEHGAVTVEFMLHKTSSWKVSAFRITTGP